MQPQSVLQGGYHHPVLRSWQERRPITKSMLMYPVFITDDPDAKISIPRLSGVCIWGLNHLEDVLCGLVEMGLKSIILFGVPSDGAKDDRGSLADDASGLIVPAIHRLRKLFPSLYIACEVCLCKYTSHGHCELVQSDGKTTDHANSINRLAEIALNYAKAGAHCVSVADMPDGRVQVIKKTLIDGGYGNRCTLMSFSAKFLSSLNVPLRENPTLAEARTCCRLSPFDRSSARQAIQRNSVEGADIIAIQPALPYIDLIADASKLIPDFPIACYQTAAEYTMVRAASAAGAYDVKPVAIELVNCMLRAGATLIITFFTPDFLDWLDG